MKKTDVTTCDESTVLMARLFYERYCLNSDNKNFRGDDCPVWGALPDEIKSHWCAVAMMASAGAMAVIREYVDLRLAHMAARPTMWASTKESLGVQLILLAEMVLRTLPEMTSGLSATSELSYRLWGPGCVVPAEPCDAAWAREAVTKTVIFLNEKCPR